VGTHASFMATMLARLASLRLDPAGPPALAELRARTTDDFSVALLDAWATVADVLTFYQERIANEGYLRTATERRSVLELAQLIGYTLRPGVAATAYLAYTLEKDSMLSLDVGNRAQSIPGPGELPQSFETAEVLEARSAWNALAPRSHRPQIFPLTMGAGHRVFFDGVATKLKLNDPLLFGGLSGDIYRVLSVRPVPAAGLTTVVVEPWSDAAILDRRARTVTGIINDFKSALADLARQVSVPEPIKRVLDILNTLSGEIDALFTPAVPPADRPQEFANDLAAAVGALDSQRHRLDPDDPASQGADPRWQQALNDLELKFLALLGPDAPERVSGDRLRELKKILDDYRSGHATLPDAAATELDNLEKALGQSVLKELEHAVEASVEALDAASAAEADPGRKDALAELMKSLSDFLMKQRVEDVKQVSSPSNPTIDGALTALKTAIRLNADRSPTDPPFRPEDLAREIQSAIEGLPDLLPSGDDAGAAATEAARVGARLAGVVRGLPSSSLRGAVAAVGAQYVKKGRALPAPSALDGNKVVNPVLDLLDDFRSGVPTGLSTGDLVSFLRAAITRVAAALAARESDPGARRTPLRSDIAAWCAALVASIQTLTSSIQGSGREAALRSVQEIVARYLDVNLGAGIEVDSAIARRVRATLQELIGKLEEPSTGGTEQSLKDLRATLVPLRAELKAAGGGGYLRVEPWLSGFIDELDDAARELSRRQAAESPAASRAVPGPPPQKRPLEVSSGLLAQLVTAPAALPADAARLRRSLSDAFASPAGAAVPLASSDLVPQLLVNTIPGLQSSLYPALANFSVNESEEPGAAYVMRVRAAPFGHNAPPRLVTGEGPQAGSVVATTEWPLSAVSISIQLAPNAPKIASITANVPSVTLTVSRESDTDSKTVSLAGGTDLTVTTRFLDVLVKFDSSRPTAVAFQFIDPNGDPSTPVKQVAVEFTDTNQARVTIDADVDRTVSLQNPAVHGATPRHEFDIFLSGTDARTPAVLTVSDVFPMARAPDVRSVLALDATYDQIVPGSWAIVERQVAEGSGTIEVYQVTGVTTVSRAAYGIAAKVTQLSLDRPWLSADDTTLASIRSVAVYAQSDRLALAEEPYDADIGGDAIELDDLYDGLKSGRWIVVSGERTDVASTRGVQASELAMVRAVEQSVTPDLPGDRLHTFLQLSAPLAYTYKRATATIYGNVVRATHGETRNEVLGSGQASRPFQSFALKQSPLTYVSAPTPSGAESTLRVRADDVLWSEVDSLVDSGPKDRQYVTKTDDSGQSTVVFGDGEHGARLPTGQENVKASYRFGIGAPGNVKAGQISLLSTRPLGVKAVVNPLPATGGADAEARDEARRNAPTAVTSLDRLVSVRDYEDFARTFAGIGKAAAARLSDGTDEVVHLTIAGAGDVPIDTQSDLYRNLRLALRLNGDPFQPFQVDVRELVTLVVSAEIKIDLDALWERVAADVRKALLAAFSFDNRELGQNAYLSEVYAAIQSAPGVAYARVANFGGVPEKTVAKVDQFCRVVPTPPEEIQRLIGVDSAHNSAAAPSASAALVGDGHDGGDDCGHNSRQMPGIAQRPPDDYVCAEVARFDSRVGAIRPAQLAVLIPGVPDTLILNEITS
jgi:predicted phage baseplate assembly protein